MEGNEHPHQELLVLSLQGQREPVYDAGETFLKIEPSAIGHDG